MISHWIKSRLLVAGIAACLTTMAAAQAGPVSTRTAGAGTATINSGKKTYIVMFSEPSVALRNRAIKAGAVKTAGVTAAASAPSASPQTGGAIPFALKANGRAHMNMRSEAALNYRASLVAAQSQYRQSIQTALGRTVPFLRTFQYAIDGAAMVLTDKEAEQVRSLQGIVAVAPSRTLHPNDDVSTRFIGADILWRGNGRRPPAPGFTYPTLSSLFGDLNQGTGANGKGIVIGVIDTGYNSQSPSFQATDASGYALTNPLGSGNYLGDCNVPGISFGGCNDKVIAVYDEYNRSQGQVGVNVEDTNGHGSHTASTAGGNARSGGMLEFSANFSGIAPHANLSIFSITAPGANSASDVAILSAIDDAISDDVVDALNMSFGGCEDPGYWSDPVSLAFLAAQDANIFTALAAGNTQPAASCPRQAAQTPGTLGNAMPWVTTVAATTIPAGEATMQLNLTGPGTPPASTRGIALTEGTYDTPLTASLPATTPIVLSPQFDAGDPGSVDGPAHGADGCSNYPAKAFNGAIALISRGNCNFSVKVPNAVAAGAIAVVISDNRVEGPFSPTVGPPSVGVPVFSIAQADGLALQTYLGAKGGAGTAALGLPQSRSAGQGDVLAGFSLLGPVLNPIPFDVIKPDIAAPGVGILAAVNNALAAQDGSIVAGDDPDIVAFLSGTSMASPHIAGAAALLMQAHPDWTAAEVKSALTMTAVRSSVTKADGKTPADLYDVGSGRVQVDKAAAAGLVLDETLDDYLVGDPTQGGDTSQLNLAGMQNFHCSTAGCSFTRTFRSTQTKAITWTTGLSGVLADKITVTPSAFTVPAGGTVTLTIAVNAQKIVPGAPYSTGGVVISPPNPLPGYQPLPDLYLPVSVAIPMPTIAVSSNVVNIDLQGKATGSATLGFAGTGSGTMTFASTAKGTAPLAWVDQQDNAGYYNFTSTHFLDPGPGDLDEFLTDDFIVSGNGVNLSTIVATGQAAHPLVSFGGNLPLHWRIYPDAAGLPGDTAAWSFDATAASAGVDVTGDVISLDLVAANQSTQLAAGRYWLVVYPDLPCNDQGDGNGCTEGWGWDTSWYGNDHAWAYISSAPGDAWSNTGTSGYGPGLAMSITTQVACAGNPGWLTVTPSTGSVTASTPATVTFNATAAGYAPDDSASAYVCFSTKYLEPATLSLIPKAVIPVQVNAHN